MTTTPPLMNDEIMAGVVRELGLEDAPEATQQAALAGVGENIIARTLFEIFKILPPAKHEEFRSLIGTASPLRLHSYLAPYIVDFPAFLQRVVADEMNETKKLLTK